MDPRIEGDKKKRLLKAKVNSMRGFHLLAIGEKEEAIRQFNHSLAVYRELEDRKGEESVGVILAVVSLYHGSAILPRIITTQNNTSNATW